MNTASKVLLGLGAAGLLAIGLAQTNESPTQTSSVSLDNYVKATETPTPAPAPTKKVETPRCNPNYSGCLKLDASDYDCAGGSGNGPYYTGMVRVLGYDEYGLDRDGDGIGCE